MGAAFTSSLGMYLVHKSKGRTDSTTSLQYLYLVQILISGVQLNFADLSLRQPIGGGFLLSIVGLAVLGYTIQTCLTRATMVVEASKLMPMGYIGIVFSFMVDVAVYGVSFDWLSVIGMGLTSVGLLSKLLTSK